MDNPQDDRRLPFPQTRELAGSFDPARLSQDHTKSSADDDFWGAPSPDLTLSIHGLSPGLVASPSFSFQTGFEFEGVSDDHEPRPPPELPLSPEQTPMPPSAEFAEYTQDSPGFLSPGEERSSYLAESPSGTSGEDSFMDPVMVQDVAREARAARLRSTTLSGGSAPWTSTPPRTPAPIAAPPAIDIFGRPLPSEPPMADPFSIIVEPTSPTPRKKSILGSGKSALVSLAESTRSGHSSQGYWDNDNITASSHLGASPPRPTAAPRQSPLPTRSQTESRLKDFMLHPSAPPAPSNVPRSSTFTPLTPPLVDLPTFPPRSHSPFFDERPRSRGAMSDVDDEPAWIPTAAVIPPRSSSPRSHSRPIPQGGLGLAARRNLPPTLQQPLATARRGSALHHSTPQSAHHPPAHSHYPTIRGAPTPTPTSASLVATSPTSTALPSPWSSAPSHFSSSTRALVHPPSSPPPNVPAPHPPPFVSLFISSADSPAKSTARPTRDSVISPPRGSMRQRPVGAEVELEDLVKRAQKVEAKLMGEGESQSAKTSSRRKDYARSGSATAGHARSETQGSKWWRFGLEGSRSSPSGKRSSSAAEGWSTLGEGSELRLGGERTAEERRLERERRKVREARRKTQDWLSSTTEATSRRGRSWGGGWKTLLASRRLRWLVGALVVIVVLAAVLGVVLSRRSSGASAVGTCACENGGTVKITSGGNCDCSCPSAWGGASCHLNATCTGDSALPVAQGLLDVADTANSLFSPSFDPSRLPIVVNTYLAASPSSKSCQSQLDLLTLPNLPFASYPSRLAWTEAAILYGWALTEAKTGLRTFASALNFAPFGDDSSTKPNSNYQTIVAGLTFDLAEMTTTVPDVSWASKASASSEQVALVSAASSATLNRMAAYAVAGSRGRTTALQHRWQELGLAEADLGSFKLAVQEAEVLLPFEASASLPTGETMMGLAQGLGNGSSFPVGLGCVAGLSGELVGRVNEVEEGAFGLAAVAEGGQFNASACLDRPIYGIVNLLRLRLPFTSADTRTSLPSQAVALSQDAKARCTLHAGETLVGASAGSPSAPTSPSTADSFGTFANLDHVLLAYSGLLTPELATELVDFVLSSPSTPPAPTSPLLTATLPILEVQLWGGLSLEAYPSSVSYVTSSLSTLSNGSTPFFGTETGSNFREWALSATSEVRWALSAEQSEAQVVDDGKSAAFEKVWATAASSATTPERAWALLRSAGLVG